MGTCTSGARVQCVWAGCRGCFGSVGVVGGNFSEELGDLAVFCGGGSSEVFKESVYVCCHKRQGLKMAI